jgi:APA family basic amino acid/polyamine antiporter
MVAVLWSYDAWYAATNLAGEMRRPERDLPIGLVAGTAVVIVLYMMMNLVYLRALPIDAMSATGRIGEAAAGALFGPVGARLMTLAVLVSTFGCISSNVLFGARIYFPMAQDGLFFPALARVHPRYRTPGACLLAQGALSVALAFSGRYDQLYTYVMFAMVAFEAMMGAAVLLLRRTRPNAPRPYRVWGYPFVPAVFVLASLFVVGNTLLERPLESGIGLALILLGFPAYAYWRRHGVVSMAVSEAPPAS